MIEGVYADQYNQQIKEDIRQQYRRRWAHKFQPDSPATAPHLFDPCAPPPGWRYDPYYEMWIEVETP